MAATLNARVGRIWPAPLLLTPQRATAAWTERAIAAARALPQWTLMATALIAALWPHWIYIARRALDGSDEPWGVLALITAIVLVVRDRRRLSLPASRFLLASAALALAAAFAQRVLPDLIAAAIAMLAVAVFLIGALRNRPATPLIALLLLALPLIASLQFYLGFPLRAMVAIAASALLSLATIDAHAAGAAIVDGRTTVLIDAPCAGIGMLWLGSYLAALLSYLNRASAARTLVNAASAALLVLAANIVRNTVLFFPESGRVDWPVWSHSAIGLAAFAGAVIPLVLLTCRGSR